MSKVSDNSKINGVLSPAYAQSIHKKIFIENGILTNTRNQ
jgi:hypothetical protein